MSKLVGGNRRLSISIEMDQGLQALLVLEKRTVSTGGVASEVV
jgi:hypothetical protein